MSGSLAGHYPYDSGVTWQAFMRAVVLVLSRGIPALLRHGDSLEGGRRFARALALLCVVSPLPASAQTAAAPTLHAGSLPASLRIDGVIDDSEWAGAEAADTFAQTDPVEGAAPSGRTTVRVQAGAKAS